MQNVNRKLYDSPTDAFKLQHRYEFIDSKELAARWGLPESWIREHVRSRSLDPILHVRFGKYVRFRWGSPELEGWLAEHMVNSSASRKRTLFLRQ
jgi:predicted DNA-binding transcriptional regulator AlpA